MKKIILGLLAALVIAPAAYAADFWIISPKGGVSFPLGDLGEHNDISWNTSVSVRKGFDREFSAGGSISYVTMPYKVTEAPEPLNIMMITGEFAFAPYMPDFFIWPYLKVGAGIFMVKYAATEGSLPPYTTVMKDEYAFGFLFGGGANYPITNEISANLEIMFNQANVQGGQGNNYNFLTFNVGVSIFIK